MIDKWITAKWEEVPMVVLSAFVTYAAIILYTRIVGLRSLSKMSAADFAMTIAIGSLFASTAATPTPTLIFGLVALACLYAGQWLVAWLRARSDWISHTVDNEPLLLMAGRTILEDNLRRANVTRDDLFGKLREANAINYDHVLAVVFETTGDISVLHADDPEATLEPEFFEKVLGRERLFADSGSS